ncbi:hypothetical protein KSS87_011187 [Heliosperma pusillum]|nr:hypothetical protein KSS87_011187 [Heliosperma pusillum]
MESVLSKNGAAAQPNYVFVPITPDKTLNCTLNCAITSVENSGIISPKTTIRYDSGEDIDSIPTTLMGGNGLLNGSVHAKSISMAKTAATTLNMNSNAGLKRAYCSKAVGSDTVNQSVPVSGAEVKDDGVILTQRKNKKQKVGPNLNKQPGEKRQNKYYWAKIDVPRPQTPAPRTPKVVTPKPPKRSKPKTPKVVTSRPKRKNDKRRPIECIEVSEHVEGEPITDSACKKVLKFNFEAVMTTDLESDIVPQVLENVFKKTTKDPICSQGIDLSDGDIAMRKVKSKRVIVYRRRFNSKCLYTCQNLVPKLEKKFKKKRLQRKKMSFIALKRFEGFNRTCLGGGLLDRTLSVKGKLRMLLPTKANFSWDSFKCVLTLLSSWSVFTIKKRLPRLRRFQDETTPRMASLSPPTIEPLKDENNVDNTPAEKGCDNSCGDLIVLHGFNKDNMLLCTHGKTNVTEEKKPNVTEEKKPKRIYKRKGKQYEFLNKVSDWHDASVEEIMDNFSQLFKSLEVNDNPKTWIVEVSDQENKTNDLYEKIRLAEERNILLHKIVKFLEEMYYYQGGKEFLKWNGSVLDSIVGVFLTQNVSDILSSNAFMNLASKYPIKPPRNCDTGVDHMDSEGMSSQVACKMVSSSQKVIVEHPDDGDEIILDPILEEMNQKEYEEVTPDPIAEEKAQKEYGAALREMLAALPYLLEAKKKGKQTKDIHIDWETIRVRFAKKSQRKPENEDSVDWEAVRKTNYLNTAKVIRRRGQHNIIAGKIKQTLNRLLDDHGSLDVEWLRDAPPQVAKAYLLSFYGLGLKSVECLRLLTLHHHGFPVDVNIGRIAIRLGWVPIKPLPPGMPFHLLQKYPLEDEIQKYLWPRLCHLKQKTLYHLHYQMITFGKVFCQKRSPNCRACPFKSDCRYYASLSESRRHALPWPNDRKRKKSKKHENIQNPFDRIIRRPAHSLPFLSSNISASSEICVSSLDVVSSSQLATTFVNVSQNPAYFVEAPLSPISEVEEEGNVSQNPAYFVEVPLSPISEVEEEDEEEGRVANAEQIDLIDIEDCCDGYMYHLKLNSDNKRASLHYNQESIIPRVFSASGLGDNSALGEMIGVSENVAFNALPKQVNVARLRTEHQVYELPKDHQLLTHLKLEPQLGHVPYLFAIWTPAQLEKTCNNTGGGHCLSEGQCTSRDDGSTISGTLLVFADYETCERPINVPTNWIWNLKKRTLYCGSGVSAVVRGTTEMEIRKCFSEGFICLRGFNRKTRAPEALPNRFHNRPKGKSQPENEDED